MDHVLMFVVPPLSLSGSNMERVCVCVSPEPSQRREDTLVLKVGSVSVAPQADNPLTRCVLRKDIYQ